MATATKFMYVLGGALVSACIFLYEHITGHTTSWSAIYALMGLSLLLAMFEAWRDEKDRSDRVIASMRLSGDVTATVIVVPHSNDETSLVVPLRIRNLGAPTIISGYSVALTVDGTVISGRPQGFRGRLGLPLPNGTHAIEYDESDLIEPQGTTQPIANGGQLRGVIFARFPLSKEITRESLPSLRVIFTDVADKAYQAKIAATAIDGTVHLIPGMGAMRRLDGNPTRESASGPIT